MSFEEVTIGPCRLIRGDCLDVLPTLAAGSVDAVVTDPPYGVCFKYESFNDNLTPDEWEAWMRPRFSEFRRVSESVLITGQARLPQLAHIEPWKWLLCWWKPAAMGRSPVGFCNWEPIAMWGRGGRDGVDVIRSCIIPSKELEGHPCPKPLDWVIGQIQLIPWAETVADPFMGSGTTGVACIRTERLFIGIEKEPKYFDIACRRIERAWQLKCSELPFDKPEPLVQRTLIED